MFPVYVILLLIYFFQRMDCYGDDAMEDTKDKNWLDAFGDGLVGVWFATEPYNNSWLTPLWTITIELWATYYIYILAMSIRFYKGRRWIYGIIIFFLITIHIIDELKV